VTFLAGCGVDVNCQNSFGDTPLHWLYLCVSMSVSVTVFLRVNACMYVYTYIYTYIYIHTFVKVLFYEIET